MDFEQAQIGAFEGELEGISVKACYFHFCQSLWRKLQEIGLAGQCCVLEGL